MQCTITHSRKIATLLLAYCVIFSAQGEKPWVMEKSQGQIEVLSRAASIDGVSLPGREIWAKTVVKASPTSLLHLLNDITHAPDWIDNCVEVKVIAGTGSTSKIVQSTFSAPWPLLNRDMVTQSTTHIDNDTITITVRDLGSQYPTQDKTVRMTHIHGQWQVKKIAAELIEISYQGMGNPSGNVPLWLANKVLINSTYTTFLQLSEIITKEKYQAPLITP